MRAPPPLCVAGAAPNGSPRRPASVPIGLSDWLQGRAAGDETPFSQKGLGGAPEGERLPSNWAVAPRVPGPGRGRSRQAAAHPPRLRRGAAPSPPALPGAPGSRREPGSGKTWSQLSGPRAGLDPAPGPARPGASPSPSPGLCAGRRRPLCPCGKWRSRQSPAATAASRAFGEFREHQRRFWGVPGLQPPGKARGWHFRSQTSDARPFPLPSVPHRNLEPH